MTDEELDHGIAAAFSELTELYRELGGHRHYGFRGYGDARNYQGPAFWSEGDCQYQLALALKRKFPGMVHVEMPVARYTFENFEPERDKRQFIDVVVSDLRDFVPDRDCFARQIHDLFVEVKYAGYSSPAFRADSVKKIFHPEFFPKDLERSRESIELRRCRRAAVLLVDDCSYLEEADDPSYLEAWGKPLPWSPEVVPLVLSPKQLDLRDAATHFGVRLPHGCPSCGSPRLKAIVHGLPSSEMQERANDIELAGCEVLGFGLDPTFQCVDCGYSDTRFHDGDPYPPLRAADERR